MFTIYDILITPFFIAILLIWANRIKVRKIANNDSYKYFIPGLLAKFTGAIMLGVIYKYYYNEGGDTVSYFKTSVAMSNLLFQNYEHFFETILGLKENLYVINYFNEETGYPQFFTNDSYAFFASKLITPICILSFKSYIPMAVLIAFLTYTGNWKLYQLFISHFPHLKKQLAIAILFVPSVVFWGSGILKDSITLSCISWFSYALNSIISKRKINIATGIQLVLSSLIILSIKPYIFMALMPGSLIWLSYHRLVSIKNPFFKFFLLPVFVIGSIYIGYYSLNAFKSQLGDYSIDNVVKKATITQNDLKREAYSKNSFDIGEFDGTIESMLSKAPLAINAALFRPYLWESKNPVMLLSGLENFAILLITLLLLWKMKVVFFFKYIFKNPLLLFSFSFSIFFAFSVGLSISNFGALVRLKIPSIPFFVAMIFIIKGYYENSFGKKNLFTFKK